MLARGQPPGLHTGHSNRLPTTKRPVKIQNEATPDFYSVADDNIIALQATIMDNLVLNIEACGLFAAAVCMRTAARMKDAL